VDVGGGWHARRVTTPETLHDERYRIASSRDARYDGQFVTAVHSTGIYCRPSCPARTPRSSGVTFYPTSAAAHQAGYRACKRCLPEATPGSPEWNLREDVAARAMRLITDGVVERDGVTGLAERLGYSSRHLTRILQDELGAGPKALSRAHRAQTARTLLTSSSLPIADVAFASGFSSIRQFNETVQEVFALTPTDLRARGSAPSSDDGVLRIQLPARAPFDAAGVFAWLAARAVPDMETAGAAHDERVRRLPVTDADPGSVDVAHYERVLRLPVTDADPGSVGAAHYERVLRLPGGPGWFAVEPSVPRSDGRGVGLDLRVRLSTLADLPTLVSRVRGLFDLDSDPVAIDALLGGIPELTESVRQVPGIRVPGAIDPHELVVRALIGQQITVSAATTALRRIVDGIGEPVPDEIAPGMRLFPTMAVLAERADDVLRGPRARIDTVRRVAASLAYGSLVVDPADTLDALRQRLLAIRGIGPWTADYVAMRVRHHPDLILPSDVAVRNGAQALGIPSEARDLSVWSERAAPWRSSLTMHLWRAAASAPRRTPASRTAHESRTKGRTTA
jgi:AraC family transcriptional regulator, regulatory protein of adaptative response / DNA-3-methyladenine glycosylase II